MGKLQVKVRDDPMRPTREQDRNWAWCGMAVKQKMKYEHETGVDVANGVRDEAAGGSERWRVADRRWVG